MITFESLFKSRCDESGNPYYWRPLKLRYTPFQWDDYGIPAVIERVLALQLVLELPVGSFIKEASTSELPISEVAKSLLISNIHDENVHYGAFKQATKTYPINSSKVTKDAAAIAAEWIAAPGHPIEKSALLECGIFMSALAFLQVCGGQSLQGVAAAVSKDEQRHVATNRGVVKKLGLNPAKPSVSLTALWYATLDWVFDGLSVPKGVPGRWFFEVDFDKSFLISESTNLVKNGFSQPLNQLLARGSIYVPPFEKENAEQTY